MTNMKTKTTLLLTALVCMMGSNAWALEQTDGVYQIGTPQDLVDFATLVNGGDKTINGVLVADIDLSGVENFTPIGTQTVNYAGTFDGQGHAVLNLTSSGQYFIGLFGTVSGGACIKNVTLKNANLKGARFVGIIGAGLGSGSATLENLGFEGTAEATDKGVAGIVGSMSGPVFTVKNCYVKGTIDGKAEAAAFASYSNNANCSFTNCWSSAFITGNEAGKTLYRGAANVVNCYDTYGDQCAKVTGVEISSGELCYKLNGDQGEIIWYQNLSEDAEPVLDSTHSKVYTTAPMSCNGQIAGEGAYTNDASQASAPAPHQYENGICTVCGQKDPDFMEADAEGFYTIKNANQLTWFATAVNKGETKLKARLAADIDLSDVENFTPIGTQTVNYAGTFDGQGHAVLNLTSSGQYFIGLFGTVSGGACIKNVTLKNANLKGARFVGIIGAGLGSGSATLENLGFEGTAEATDKGVGGIVGSMSGPVFTVKNCYVKGTINGKAEAAAFASYSNNANCSFTNCWSSATVTGNEAGKTLYRGAASVVNCYDIYGDQSTPLTDTMLSNGELCYLLNGSSVLAPTWRQTLGTDETPVLDTAHGIVNQIGAAGYATLFIPGCAVEIPEGVSVFTGFIDTPWIALRPLSGIIPAGTAVVLQGAEGYYNFEPTIATHALGNNELKGTAEPLTATGAQYVLAQKDSQVGFYKAEGIIPAGKAYIEYTGAEGVKAFFFGEATGLTPTFSQGETEPAAVYDLSGRRVEKLGKGIYIVNGKVVKH